MMPDAPSAACDYPAWKPPARVALTITPEHPCSYLPYHFATTRAAWASRIPSDLYHRFMDAGFRRSGRVIYQPICRGCRKCLPIRVPVETFRPSATQRRVRRRNRDLTVERRDSPVATDETFDLYTRYVRGWHDCDDDPPRQEFESFLYESPVDTLEFTYRDRSGTLLAVGICDLCPQALSSVYFYFDPAHARRSLGTFGALYEIEFARQLKLSYYYLGYWVAACPSMSYKADFRPCQILSPEGQWNYYDRNESSEL